MTDTNMEQQKAMMADAMFLQMKSLLEGEQIKQVEDNEWDQLVQGVKQNLELARNAYGLSEEKASKIQELLDTSSERRSQLFKRQ